MGSSSSRFEHRWPVLITLLAVVVLLSLLPRELRLFPSWLGYVVGAALFVPMVAVGLTAAKAPWLRLERSITLIMGALVIVGSIANIMYLTRMMVHRAAGITGVQLLASSVAVWVNNVLAFSLIYWQIDRGGPGGRMKEEMSRPDWLFPQESTSADNVLPGWRATFVDYLYLAFSTATAFSTTEVAPMTSRAKLLMMFEAAISLVTIVVVAARSINILGS